MIKNSSAILIVLIAGLFWSFGPLVVRYIDDAQLIPWQYLFFRGSIIFLVLNIYLFLAEGLKFTKNYNKIGLSGLIGGVSLGIANISFILSITTTTAAVTMMMLATQPFVAAILAYIFLKEKISMTTFIAIVVAAGGIIFMSLDSKGEGSLFGLINGLLSSLGFAGCTVSLRWRKKTRKFTTVAIAGIFCAAVAILVLIFLLAIICFGVFRIAKREYKDNPESTFTPLPRDITPLGIELDPTTVVDLSNSENAKK